MSFGSFGSTAQQQPAPSFGGFGSSSFSFPSSTASTFSTPQSSSSTFGSGLFGSSTSSSSSGFGSGGFSFGSTSGFGAGTTAAFGSSSSSAGGTGGGFSFGSFGSSQPAQSTFSFGSSAFPSTSTVPSAFGGGGGGFSAFNPQGSSGGSVLFGLQQQQLQPLQQGMQQASAQSQAEQSASSLLVKQLLELKAAYDPTSPLCRFQSVFYNRVADPSKLRSFIPPPHANPALYQRAVRSNPDPSSLTPSLAVGFEDLKRRLDAQREARAVHEQAVRGIREAVEEMRSVHWAYTVPVLKGLRETAEEQGLRVLRVVNRLLEVEARGVGLTEEERDYREKVERMAVEVQREGWMEKAKEMQRRARMGGLAVGGEGRGMDGGEAVELSMEDREKLRAVIQTQTRALEFLIDTVKEDLQLLSSLRPGGGAVAGGGERVA